MVVAAAGVVVHLRRIAIEADIRNRTAPSGAADQRVVPAVGVARHGKGVAVEVVDRTITADQHVVAAAAVAIHDLGVAIEGVDRPIAAKQMVVAAAGVVVHLEGVAIEDIASIGAADQRVVAAAGVVVHGAGVAIEGVGGIAAADQRVIAAAGMVVHGEGVAIKSVDRIIDADQRIVGAALMVREGSGLGIWDRLRHGSPPSVRTIALADRARRKDLKNCPQANYRLGRHVGLWPFCDIGPVGGIDPRCPLDTFKPCCGVCLLDTHAGGSAQWPSPLDTPTANPTLATSPAISARSGRGASCNDPVTGVGAECRCASVG